MPETLLDTLGSTGGWMKANPLKGAVVKALRFGLPKRLKKLLVHFCFHLDREYFQQFAHDYCVAPDMQRGLALMKTRGFAPQTIIDVGALDGNWSRAARSIWPSCRIVMIEPNAERRPALTASAKEINAEVINALVGAVDDCVVDFNVMEAGSSVLAERSPVARKVERRTLQTIDTLLQFHGPALLKIDTQGYELEVLAGARLSLEKVEAILLENLCHGDKQGRSTIG